VPKQDDLVHNRPRSIQNLLLPAQHLCLWHQKINVCCSRNRLLLILHMYLSY